MTQTKEIVNIKAAYHLVELVCQQGSRSFDAEKVLIGALLICRVAEELTKREAASLENQLRAGSGSSNDESQGDIFSELYQGNWHANFWGLNDAPRFQDLRWVENIVKEISGPANDATRTAFAEHILSGYPDASLRNAPLGLSEELSEEVACVVQPKENVLLYPAECAVKLAFTLLKDERVQTLTLVYRQKALAPILRFIFRHYLNEEDARHGSFVSLVHQAIDREVGFGPFLPKADHYIYAAPPDRFGRDEIRAFEQADHPQAERYRAIRYNYVAFLTNFLLDAPVGSRCTALLPDSAVSRTEPGTLLHQLGSNCKVEKISRPLALGVSRRLCPVLLTASLGRKNGGGVAVTVPGEDGEIALEELLTRKSWLPENLLKREHSFLLAGAKTVSLMTLVEQIFRGIPIVKNGKKFQAKIVERKDLRGGTVETGGIETTEVTLARAIDRYYLKENDIILAPSYSEEAPPKIAIMPPVVEGLFVPATNLVVIRPNELIAVTRFLAYYLASSAAAAELNRRQVGTTRALLSIEGLKEIAVPSLKLEDQRAVAEKLQKVEDEYKKAQAAAKAELSKIYAEMSLDVPEERVRLFED